MAVHSDGSYGVPEGIVSCSRSACPAAAPTTIEQGLEVGEFAQGKIDRTVAELEEERDAVHGLGFV